MNTNHDELEELLGRELHGQVDGMNTAPLGLGDVQGRASSIRRHRRIGVGVGVAAALAVIVPTALMVGDAANRTQDLDPANPSPSPIGTVQTTLTLDGLERGDAPQIEYFTRDGVVLPGEGQQPLDQSYQAIVPSEADGGWLALGPARDEIVTMDDSFQRVTSEAATDGLVSNPDRSLVAWAFPESGAQTLRLHSTTDPDAGLAWDFPEFPMVDPVDFVGDDSLVYQLVDNRGRVTIGIANPDGSTTEFEGDFVQAIAASPVTHLVSVQTKSNKDGSGCFGVAAADDTSETVWDTCDYSIGAFSPDGGYVLASSPYGSGAGITSIAVLDAWTGRVLATFEQAGDSQISLNNVAWESSDTFVAVANEAMNNTILRFGVDGTLEETIEPVAGDPFGDQPLYLGDDRTRNY
jgi:hypothetical protein